MGASEYQLKMQQLDKQDEVVKKNVLSTYSTLTAETIWQNLGIKVTPQAIKAHIQNPGSFYHKLLRLPASNAYNDIIFEQCRDLLAYSQQYMIDYLFTKEKVNKSASELAKQKVDKAKENLIAVVKKFDDAVDKHKALIVASDKALKEVLSDWLKSAKAQSEKIADHLRSQGVGLPNHFTERLTDLLASEAEGIKVSKDTLKKFNVKAAPTPAQKAVAYLLAKEL